MTSDGDALLRAVGENTWDDTPRLVYADWLEEHDQPERAEFIRLEIAIETRIASRQRITQQQITRREQLAFVKAQWLKELPRFTGVEWDTGFDRGFPSRVNTSSASAFLKNAERIYQISPVSWVKIRGISAKTREALPQSPYLARLRGLDLRTCHVGDEGVHLLCASPHLGRLGVLNLSHVGMTDTGLLTIAACWGLGNLWALWLSGNPITDVGATALAKSPHFPKLTSVYHHDTPITSRGGEALDQLTAGNRVRLPKWNEPADPADRA